MKSLFEQNHYRPFLAIMLGQGKQRTGLKLQFSRAVGCQPGYLTQVLKQQVHLSLEQAERANGFFGHSEIEAHYFLLLVQRDRAGTTQLRSYFDKQLERIRSDQLEIRSRLSPSDELSPENQARFYSLWIFSAIHVGLTVPELQTIDSLSNYFNLPRSRVAEAVNFMEDIGLAKREGTKIRTTKNTIRISRPSPDIVKHHTNWRQQAVESLERERPNDLHYSGVVSLAARDVAKIKDVLLEGIQNALKIVVDSPEELVYGLNFDFFNLDKRIGEPK